MKLRIIKAVIGWLAKHYPYLLKDAVIPKNAHVHLNPKKRVKEATS